jgi:hypothetical protein
MKETAMKDKNTLEDILKNPFIQNEHSDDDNLSREEIPSKDTSDADGCENSGDIITISLDNAVTGKQYTLGLPSDICMAELLPEIARELKIANGSDFTLMNAAQNFYYQPVDTLLSTNTENTDYCILQYSIVEKTTGEAPKKENKSGSPAKDEENTVKRFEFAGMTFFVCKEQPGAKLEKNEKGEWSVILTQCASLLEENAELKKRVSDHAEAGRGRAKTEELLNATRSELQKTMDQLDRTSSEMHRWKKNERVSKVLAVSSIVLIILGIAIVIPRYTETLGTMALVLGLLLSVMSVTFHKIQNLYGMNHGRPPGIQPRGNDLKTSNKKEEN